MQIIAEMEPTAGRLLRRHWAISVRWHDGYEHILIRTITARDGWWQAPVGGGIVAQSVPEREYEETWHKATGLIRALR